MSKKRAEDFFLIEYLQGILPLSQKAMKEAEKRLDDQMKPFGSLGRLEELAVQLSGIMGQNRFSFDRCCTIVMAADNGICKEGVVSAPPEFTKIQTENIAWGLTGISALSRACGSDVCVVDVGIDGDCENRELEGEPEKLLREGKVLIKKIRRGTDSFLTGPAMSIEDAEKAVCVGVEVTESLIQAGYQLLGTGEMGIGNTSTATAVISVLAGRNPREITGRGAGLTDEAFSRKIQVISEGIQNNGLHWDRGIITPSESVQTLSEPKKILEILSKIGGLDICALTGCYLAAAKNRIPIVIDGVISIAAALAAVAMEENAKQYMIPSHKSPEPAYQAAAAVLGLRPVLDLDMRLGEGTGCPLMFSVLRGAAACFNEIATFQEQQVNGAFLVDNR